MEKRIEWEGKKLKCKDTVLLLPVGGPRERIRYQPDTIFYCEKDRDDWALIRHGDGKVYDTPKEFLYLCE